MEPPWIESPAVELDGDGPVRRRFVVIPAPMIERSRDLLDLIFGRLPSSYRRFAPLAALRTLNRFTAEAKVLAARIGTDWHRVLAANLPYALVVESFACSTVALVTTDGPVLARNMDWSPGPAFGWTCCARGESRAARRTGRAGSASSPGCRGADSPSH